MSDDELTRAILRPFNTARRFLIVIQSGAISEIGRLIPIVGDVSIGRAKEASVVIKDGGLSRRHVEVWLDGDACILRDLQSTNGTWVNGVKIAEVELVPGDRVRLGSTLLQFHDGSERNPSTPEFLVDAGVAFWEFDPEASELTFSEHVDRALGLEPSTLGRKRVTIDACVHPEDRARVLAALTRVGSSALELELRLIPAPHLERSVLLRGAANGQSGSLVDLTTLKRRDAALARSALMFETFVDGVALSDRAGRIVEVNSALASFVGAPAKDVVGKDVFATVSMREPERWFSEASREIAANGRWRATLELAGPPSRVVEVLAFPLRTDRDEEAGLAWVFRDVSDQRRMTAQIAFLDRLASLGTLSAGVAHEINNPLMFVLGNAEVLQEELAEVGRPDLVAAATDIIQGAQRIAGIVRDLKAFARAEPPGSIHVLDPAVAVSLAIKMTSLVVRARARVDVAIQPVPLVRGVESRLTQVVVNLLMNAVQAIPDARAGSAVIAVAVALDGDEVAIEVRDDGIGISAETAARVFEPFFTTKSSAGTGLGLSICHGLVTDMGGSISLESEPGRGTVARVRLPVAPATVAIRPLETPAPVTSPALRVLVIDDEPMIRRALVRILHEHRVSCAAGCVEAISLLCGRCEAYDVILCDLSMPDGSGMDIYERLVTDRPEMVNRLVFVTGAAVDARAQDFLAATSNPCLAKPVDREQLRRVLVETSRRAASSGPRAAAPA